MRDLNSASHKLRRPSFSNTLSELPEVEEPEYVKDILSHVTDGSPTSFKVLPPINNEDISPSPRPRFNTIPEGVAERPKCLAKTKHTTVSERSHRHSYHGRSTQQHLQSLDQDRGGSQCKTRIARRESERTPRRHSFSSDKQTPDTNRRPSLTVPPIERSRDVSPPAGDKMRRSGSSSSMNATNVSQDSNISLDVSDQKLNAEVVSKTESSNKDIQVIKWRKALERAKNESPYGSFENLAGSFDDNSYRRRRFSLPLDHGWDRRLSNPAFADTSRKVDILLKYGKAVRNKYSKTTNSGMKSVLPPKAFRTLADFMLEMPKKPRFSSFMSPEAQFSLMKGYEDKLYRKLSNSLPGDHSILKRNKTPKNTIVDIKVRNSPGFIGDLDEDESDDDDNDDDKEQENDPIRASEDRKTSSSFITQLNDCASNFQTSLSTVKSDSISTTPSELQCHYPDSKTVLRNLRRLSISLEKGNKASINRPFRGQFDNYDDDEDEHDICSPWSSRQRSHSLPSMGSVPFQRRLMMSHRLQSAMDILDSMESQDSTQQQQQQLSPRLGDKGKGSNLSQYNSWVADWCKEFSLKNNCHG